MAGGDAGRRESVGNRGAVCNRANDWVEIFYVVKRRDSSELE